MALGSGDWVRVGSPSTAVLFEFPTHEFWGRNQTKASLHLKTTHGLVDTQTTVMSPGLQVQLPY